MFNFSSFLWYIIFITFLFSINSTTAFGQDSKPNYVVQRITTEIQKTIPGISQNTLRCMYKDHKGLLWFGTWDGLNRFDGIRFDIIRMKVGSIKEGLSNNTINAITQDSHHNLWVGTDGGINCFSYNNLKRKRINLINKSAIINDTIHAVYIDNNDRIWLGSQKGLGVINANRDSILLFSQMVGFSTELDGIEIRQITKFNNGILWIGTANGLYKYTKSSNKITHYQSPQISDNHITFIQQYKDSSLFVGTENGLNIINLYTNYIIQKFPFSSKKIAGENVFLSCLLANNNEFLFGISTHGLNRYNIKEDKFSLFKSPNISNGNSDYYNAAEEDISCMLKDNYNNLWLGTAWNGFLCISPEPLLFKKFVAKKNGLNDKHIWAFLFTNNELWIGTEKGINIYNNTSHKIRYLTTKNGLCSNRIRALQKDKYGRIWIGTFDNGINIINTDKKILHFSYTDSSSVIPDNKIWHFVEDTAGFMWVSTHNGLAKINYQTFSSVFYKNTPKDSNSLSSNSVFNANFDSHGRLWVSTYHGLNLFRPKTNDFKHYYHQEGNHSSLSTNKIFKVYDDGEGNLWIATIGGGLNKLDLNSGEIEWFTTKDGLSNNIIYSLIDDGMGYLWLSSNLGINRFNKHTHIVNTYSVEDGLQSSEFNFGAALIDSSHNIYMGGMQGFNVFNPQRINNKDYKAPLCISDVFVNNVGSIYNINFGDTVYLEPSLNSFEIKYTKLNLKNSSKELFRHKLTPYETEWINTNGDIAKAKYTNIPAGTYIFTLQSANKYGVWNTKPYNLSIVVKQYWYKTYWFISSAIIIFLLIIITVIRMRFQRVKFKSEVEKQIYQLEKQSLRLQMNPHFIFNTLNSIQSYILNNDKKESISYLSKFAKLMRSILQNSSESIISLKSEIEILNHYIVLEQLRFDKSFDYKIEVDEYIDIDFIGIPGMLIQIYVENAIIHGISPLKERRGYIKISFKIKGDMLQCAIEDNGVGREYHKNNSNKLHVSKGMLISKKRLEILNRKNEESPLIIEDLRNNAGQAIGTRVILMIDIEEIDY